MYTQYTKDRVIKRYPVIDLKESHTSYMKVEDVLRYLDKKALALQQYVIGDMPNHFFLCLDIKEKIGGVKFRSMECEVTQYLCKDKE